MAWVYLWSALGAFCVFVGWASGFTENTGTMIGLWIAAAAFFCLAWIARRDLRPPER